MRNFIKRLLLDEYENKFELFIRNVAITFSQVGNAVLLGDPDETISSRCGKADRAEVPAATYLLVPLINFLFDDYEHCENAIEEEEGQHAPLRWWRRRRCRLPGPGGLGNLQVGQ